MCIRTRVHSDIVRCPRGDENRRAFIVRRRASRARPRRALAPVFGSPSLSLLRVHASAEGCLPSRRSVHRTGHPFPLRPRRRRPSADCYIVFAKPTKRTLIRNSVLYLGNLFSTNEKKKTKNTCHRVLRKPGKCRNPSIIKQVEGRQRGRGTPTRSRSRSVAGCTVCATSTRHRRLGFAVGAPTEGGELCTFFFFIKRLLCLVKNLMKSPMCVC